MAKNRKTEASVFDDCLQGLPEGDGRRVAIVVAKFNSVITSQLMEGAKAKLIELGVAPDNILVTTVPGAFELPLVAKTLAGQGYYDAIITLGCVIKGETAHFDYVCSEAARGVTLASLETGVPIIFGVLTTDNLAQAEDRALMDRDDKGGEAAVAALEMASLLQQIEQTLRVPSLTV